MDGKEIANYTLKALGGSGRLVAMLGAEHFGYDKKGTLSFHFKMCSKANIVSFELTPMDEYKVTFFKSRGINCKKVKETDGLHVGDLRKHFEGFTGLYLSL